MRCTSRPAPEQTFAKSELQQRICLRISTISIHNNQHSTAILEYNGAACNGTACNSAARNSSACSCAAYNGVACNDVESNGAAYNGAAYNYSACKCAESNVGPNTDNDFLLNVRHCTTRSCRVVWVVAEGRSCHVRHVS